jgi:hypothetical protein
MARPSLSSLVIAVLVAATILRSLGVISPQALDYVFLCLVAWALFKMIRNAGLHPVLAAMLAVASSGSLVGLQILQPSLRYMPYLVIAPANLMMAYIFARGLFPGRQPILLRLIREIRKEPVTDPAFQNFVISQCALWSLMTFATACLAFASMVSDSVWPGVLNLLTGLIVIQIAWFVLSHFYAALRYNRPETWLDTLRAMTRPGIWSNLRA